jgi:TetR/AcrR family transcriptional repressor of nem operon
MSKGEDTRRKIVEKAAALFNRRGFEGSAFSELMKSTGLQKGGIYRHFGSKEELAAEAFDYAWEAAWTLRTRDVDPTTPAAAQLKQLITNFVDRRPPVPGGCPLLNTAIDSDDGNPILRDRARKALATWKASLTTLIANGIKRGELPNAPDPTTAATIIIATLEGALMISRLEKTTQSLRAAAHHLAEQVDRWSASPPQA